MIKINSSLIAVMGIIIGVLLNEVVRRRSRIESLSKDIFNKRLEIHEDLYKMILYVENIFNSLIDTQDEKVIKELWGENVIRTSKFLDEKYLYLDEKLIVQCMLTLIGNEDALIVKDQYKLREVHKNFKETKRMIKNSAGITASERTIKRIAGIKLKSDFIKKFNKNEVNQRDNF